MVCGRYGQVGHSVASRVELATSSEPEPVTTQNQLMADFHAMARKGKRELALQLNVQVNSESFINLCEMNNLF